MTIETPTQEDFGQWLCTIGEKGEEPFGSFVELTNSYNSARAIVGGRVRRKKSLAKIGLKEIKLFYS